MRFSKEEISLCKQIAEKHVKEIYYGIWVAKEKRKTIEVSLWNLPIGLTEKQRKEGKWIPLWTISDCLEFLRGEGWWVDEHFNNTSDQVIVRMGKGLLADDAFDSLGTTHLEAFLKAVLAVLEEK